MRVDATLTREWVIPGRCASAGEAYDLAERGVHSLSRIELEALAGADKQAPVRAESEPVAEMIATRHFRRLPPDHLQVRERAACLRVQGERGACDRGSARSARACLNVTEVDKSVGCVPRMQNHIAKATLSTVRNRW